uniref:5' exonuclease Apollo n=1 Tax=Ananas comosus var. bracteatus TaxID=296719 RepID=A0A6V7PEU8_ANACO|nr:unnamed protein product [Ananas comosus var. bracteatus]
MQVVDIITRHPNHDVIIGIDTLGKEDLLLHISQALGTKIWVWPERLQIMHLLGFDDIFTTNSNLTRVRAVPRYSFTFDTLEALNTIHPTIGIMPLAFLGIRKSSIMMISCISMLILIKFSQGQSGHHEEGKAGGAKIAETDALCTSKLNVKIG